MFYIDCFVLFSPDIMKDKSFVSEIVCSMWKQHVWYNNTLKDTAYIYLSIYSLLKSVSFPARHIVWNSSFLYSNSNKLCNFYFMVFHSALHTYFIIDKYLHTAQVTRSTSQRRRPSRFCHQQNTAAIKLLNKKYIPIYLFRNVLFDVWLTLLSLLTTLQSIKGLNFVQKGQMLWEHTATAS